MTAPPSSSIRAGGNAPGGLLAPALLVVVALSIALGLFLATRVPLVDPDEGRNSEVAREMIERGDFVIPHLAGTPYLDKPPLLFWAAAAAIRVAGPTRWAPRLPAVLAGALTLLVLASLARGAGGAGLAWRAAALLAAAPLFVVIGAYVIFDMPLTLCVTVVWTLIAREVAEGPSPTRRAWMFAAFAFGLFAKGPAMLAWTFGGSFTTALLMRRREPVTWLLWWPGWLMVLASVGTWFALAAARHPEFPRYAVFEESVERFATKNFGRDQPWWFVPATMLGGTLPWSLASPWSADRVRSAAEAGGPLGRASLTTALAFVLFAFVFFTVSHSKLVTYLLPALPPMALIAALAWSTVRDPRRLAFGLVVLAIPLALVLNVGRLQAEAMRSSGEPLALAIEELDPGGSPPAIRYERCYSPGTDFLLGRRGVVVSERGDQTTSVYQGRYRESLKRRGLWALLDYDAPAPAADVIVRPKPDDWAKPAGYVRFFEDQRFTAYRRER